MIKDVDNIRKDEFTRMVHEAKSLERKDRKDLVQIKRKSILKQRLVQLYVSGNYSNSQIASIMCVSKQTINKLLKDQDILDMIIAYQNEEKEYIDARLKSLREKSMETMFELLDSEEDTVRLNTAKDILDRTGHAVKKDSNVNINVTYEEQLNNLSALIDTGFINAIDTTYMSDETHRMIEENNISERE